MNRAKKEMFEWRWLGQMNFADALKMQEEIVARKQEQRLAPDELLMLEHEPVYTIGRTPDQSSLLDPKKLPHPLFTIGRGGQATYHGPGQLIGYPIVDLRRCGQDLHRYLRWIEDLLVKTLRIFDVGAWTRPGLTGVWTKGGKIASIGVGVRHWITMHGFALNVSGDLEPFNHIVPCGIQDVTMTSIEKETGNTFTPEDVSRRVAEIAYHSISNLTSEGSLLHIAPVYRF